MTRGVDIRDEDHGYRDLLERYKHIKGAVNVGVDAVPHMPTGQMTDEIGAFHEFGNGVPERSFLRAWVDENQQAIQEKLTDLGLTYLLDGEINAWQIPFGQWAVKEIKNRIAHEIPPPLAPKTIARKQGSGAQVPLIDTNQLMRAIIDEWEIS
jgi:hypothetical protein